MRVREHFIELDDDERVMSFKPASAEGIRTVIWADENSDDGRSEWLWVRLPNGDLMLGLFPQGETYMLVEDEANSRE